jgi:hypothetical protein
LPSSASPASGSCCEGSPKPTVVLLGNSLLKDIHNRLSWDFNTTKMTAYTIPEAKAAVDSLTSKPSAICFQLITNDVMTSQNATDVVRDHIHLIDQTKKKFPQSKVIVSLAPHRMDNAKFATMSRLVNASLEDHYQDSDIKCLSNSNITTLRPDGLHPTYSAHQMSIKHQYHHSQARWPPPHIQCHLRSSMQHQSSSQSNVRHHLNHKTQIRPKLWRRSRKQKQK